MEQITVKVSRDTAESLATYAESHHDANRSEAIRDLLDKGLRYDDRTTELETEVDRLQRELRASNARQDDVEELVEYVEEERSLQRRRQERQDAPAWRRAKWWLFGRSSG